MREGAFVFEGDSHLRIQAVVVFLVTRVNQPVVVVGVLVVVDKNAGISSNFKTAGILHRNPATIHV